MVLNLEVVVDYVCWRYQYGNLVCRSFRRCVFKPYANLDTAYYFIIVGCFRHDIVKYVIDKPLFSHAYLRGTHVYNNMHTSVFNIIKLCFIIIDIRGIVDTTVALNTFATFVKMSH